MATTITRLHGRTALKLNLPHLNSLLKILSREYKSRSEILNDMIKNVEIWKKKKYGGFYLTLKQKKKSRKLMVVNRILKLFKQVCHNALSWNHCYLYCIAIVFLHLAMILR